MMESDSWSTLIAPLLEIPGIIFSVILAGLFILVYVFWSSKSQKPTGSQVSVQVLVLGDIGRSPRMQYHALSIAKHGGSVQLIGYHESALLSNLAVSPNVQICPLKPPPSLLRFLPFIIAGPLKVVWQVINLSWVLLFGTKRSQWLLVQNPPSIPTLAIATYACYFRKTRLMIDWHNYGWTILAGTRGASHPFVRISRYYESLFGRIAPDANLTVTHAMLRQLKGAPYNIKTPIVAMHDRPAAIFRPVFHPRDRRTFLSNIPETSDSTDAIISGHLRLLVSSTSWTPDEDFSIFLDALVKYGSSRGRIPLLVIITGRGPQKAMYEAKIAALAAEGRLPSITIKTAFLSFENYAQLLAAADLGICLHMSSSGVDLPMKVVDMFGAGLPVLAYSAYESFSELVKEGENGCGFETPAQLAQGLHRLLDPDNGGYELDQLKTGATKEGARRWDEEWDENVKPLLGFPGPKQ